MCIKNQIECLKAYKHELYGPPDPVSNCTTLLLSQVDDKQSIGAGFMWSPQWWNSEMGHDQPLNHFTLFSNSMPKDKAFFIAA